MSKPLIASVIVVTAVSKSAPTTTFSKAVFKSATLRPSGSAPVICCSCASVNPNSAKAVLTSSAVAKSKPPIASIMLVAASSKLAPVATPANSLSNI